MKLRWNLDEPNLASARRVVVPEAIDQPRAILRRIPFHEHELGIEAVTLALRRQGIEELLRPRELVDAVIVVARRRHDAEIRGSGHA